MATLERNVRAQGWGWLVAEDITLIGGDGGKVNPSICVQMKKKGLSSGSTKVSREWAQYLRIR